MERPSNGEIADEISTDPKRMGYTGMSAAEITSLIHDETLRPKRRDTFTSAELYDLIDESEFKSLPLEDQAALQRILDLPGDINCAVSSRAHAVIQASFTPPSQSLTNYDSATAMTQSRAQELSWRLTEGDVERAMAHAQEATAT